MPGIGDGFLVSELTAEAADAFVGVGGAGSGSPLLMLELRQLGGALREAPGDAGALASLDAGFCQYGVGIVMGPGAAEAIGAHLARVREALEPWAAGRYLNFAEQPGSTPECFDEATYARLREVKATYDGGDLFRSNHPVEPALRPAAS